MTSRGMNWSHVQRNGDTGEAQFGSGGGFFSRDPLPSNATSDRSRNLYVQLLSRNNQSPVNFLPHHTSFLCHAAKSADPNRLDQNTQSSDAPGEYCLHKQYTPENNSDKTEPAVFVAGFLNP